jgi:hypothetical protein
MVMRELARIATGAFEIRHGHVGVKRCYRSKISKGGFAKVTIGLMGPMRKGDTIRCLLMSGMIDNVVQRSSRRLQSYTHAIEE